MNLAHARRGFSWPMPCSTITTQSGSWFQHFANLSDNPFHLHLSTNKSTVTNKGSFEVTTELVPNIHASDSMVEGWIDLWLLRGYGFYLEACDFLTRGESLLVCEVDGETDPAIWSDRLSLSSKVYQGVQGCGTGKRLFRLDVVKYTSTENNNNNNNNNKNNKHNNKNNNNKNNNVSKRNDEKKIDDEDQDEFVEMKLIERCRFVTPCVVGSRPSSMKNNWDHFNDPLVGIHMPNYCFVLPQAQQPQQRVKIVAKVSLFSCSDDRFDRGALATLTIVSNTIEVLLTDQI